MGKYTIFYLFENPRRGMEAKILQQMFQKF